MRNLLVVHWKKLAIAAALIVVGALVYFFVIAPSQKPKEETAKVRRGNLEEQLTIPGEIGAEEHATLKFQTAGQLAWVGVKVGDYVQKYQSVASLDQRALQKTLQKYLEAYTKDRNAFDQDKDTYKNSVITDTIKRTISDSQSDLNSSVLDVELQDIALKFANLWTPIEGLVVRADSPQAGVNIIPTDAVFEIVNPATIHFVGTADQTEVPKLKVGDVATLTLDAFPDQTFKGVVTKISFVPTVNDSGTNYEVEVTLSKDNSDYRYRLGMTGDATFTTAARRNVLFLPIKFVKSEKGKKYVTVVKSGKNTKVFVTTGLESDNDVEITSGLTLGETVINAK